ncbi:uridine kinase family protein [Legionella sp. D16C41]|uniref:uridine kinase family protein n=1 Tax=Legionella sp. D16C41 TaxID=3402688 RepID=UPI003AF78A0C
MFIVFIGGPSGGGKTTLANQLKSGFKSINLDAEILKMDNYYKIRDNTKPRQNYDTPEAVDLDLLVENLEKLQAGQAIESPLYCFKTSDRLSETEQVKPTDILIVEGIFALLIANCLETSDKIGAYIQPDSYLANIERRASRDEEERNTSIEETKRRELKSFVRDGFFNYIARTRYQADIVIANNAPEDINSGIHEIITLCKGRLQQAGQNPESIRQGMH